MEQIIGFNVNNAQEKRIFKIRDAMLHKEKSMLTQALDEGCGRHHKEELIRRCLGDPPTYRERGDKEPCSF